MLRYLLFLAIAVAVVGCNDTEGNGAAAKAHAAGQRSEPASLLILPEDVLIVHRNTLASGPSISGSVQPGRRADLRAEVSAVVLAVLKENGDPVRPGDLLVRFDDTSIRDALNAAEVAARSASQAYSQAERQFQRLTKLRESGLVSTLDVEDAEIRRNNADSDLEMAKSRVVTARQQLERTQVRAPFDGVVSDRQVSIGDTAQIGKELLKVIDPASMRFEGRVSIDALGEVKVGQRVVLCVHGFGEQELTGTVTRVNPAANPTTRQVEVLVGFIDKKQQPRLAGLYAEGRIEARDTAILAAPESAFMRTGNEIFSWRVRGLALQKIRLILGQQEPQTGEYEVKQGLTEGDQILRYPSGSLHDGQKVTMAPTGFRAYQQ